MNKVYYLLMLVVCLSTGCAADHEEELIQNPSSDTLLYLNTGTSVRPISVDAVFPWLSAADRVAAVSDIFKSFSNANSVVRSTGGEEKVVVAYGYQSFEREKKGLRAFTKEQCIEMGIPRDYYVVTVHRVKQTFSCELGKEIIPYNNYGESKHKNNMGILAYDASTKKDLIGFDTSLRGKGVTKAKTFEGYTKLYYFHSDLAGRQGYKRWWPCAPEDLVWIYKEKTETVDWGI